MYRKLENLQSRFRRTQKQKCNKLVQKNIYLQYNKYNKMKKTNENEIKSEKSNSNPRS